MKTLSLIGYADGQGAGDTGCADGPDAFKQSPWFQQLTQENPKITWDTTLYPTTTSPDKFTQIQTICTQLALQTQSLTQNKKQFVVMGGDHTSAIGTWSGVSEALHTEGPVGLIWVDAHMDSHTPETSPSGNIHGMPLAALLGYGDSRLTNILQARPKLLPEHVCLIGIRSFESGEAALLRRLNVPVFYMQDIKKRGLKAVFAEALSIVCQSTVGFGVSIDLDAFDPSEAPGVGTPEQNGLSVKTFCEWFETVKTMSNFVGAEIAEFNPHHDKNHQTEKVIYQLIKVLT